MAFPHPEVVGARFQFQAALLENGRSRSQFEKALRETLEPMLIFQIEGVYGSWLLTQDPEDAARRGRDFERETGCRVMTPLSDVPFPATELTLTPRDWKILRVLRRFPDPDWSEIAREVGVTLRSLERRVGRLMDANALFFQPLLDFRRLPVSVAWVGLLYGPETEPAHLRRRLAALHPDILEVFSIAPFERFLPAEGRPPHAGSLSFLLPVASGSSGDQLRRDLAEESDVVDVLVGFPTQSMTVGTGVDSIIARAMGTARGTGASPSGPH